MQVLYRNWKDTAKFWIKKDYMDRVVHDKDTTTCQEAKNPGH